ncbi:MAG: hypothetical protein HRT71_17150 [Flavobacteriales bacterium]|nr:hypothetical protein [Flavobacteriales bacterium]
MLDIITASSRWLREESAGTEELPTYWMDGRELSSDVFGWANVYEEGISAGGREHSFRLTGTIYTTNLEFDVAILAASFGTSSMFRALSNRAVWSGTGAEAAAIKAGFTTLSKTRAGQNLAKLTSDMVYKPGSQAYNMWGRLSQACVKGIPKGSKVHLYITRSKFNDLTSIYNAFEKSILNDRNIKTIINFID